MDIWYKKYSHTIELKIRKIGTIKNMEILNGNTTIPNMPYLGESSPRLATVAS
jgi:hypothetical protein